MNTQTDDERALRQLIAKWSSAARQRDYEGVMAHHAANILMFDVPPPFQSEGLEAYRRTWDLLFGSLADPPTFDFSDIRVTAGADVAFATAHGKCLSSEKCLSNEKGAVTEIHFRLTMCFQKQDGEWLVVHEHHSVPAE